MKSQKVQQTNRFSTIKVTNFDGMMGLFRKVIWVTKSDFSYLLVFVALQVKQGRQYSLDLRRSFARQLHGGLQSGNHRHGILHIEHFQQVRYHGPSILRGPLESVVLLCVVLKSPHHLRCIPIKVANISLIQQLDTINQSINQSIG